MYINNTVFSVVACNLDPVLYFLVVQQVSVVLFFSAREKQTLRYVIFFVTANGIFSEMRMLGKRSK